MKTTWRLLLALAVAFSITACKTTKPEAEAAPEPAKPAPVVEQEAQPVAAPDPHDYTDVRNFDNSDSLLSKRVVYFDFDKSEVKPEYRDIVAAHAAYAVAHPTARITLEGHADERGTREYNLALGERRANAVAGLMSAAGVRGDQIKVISYGEERPVCRVSNEDCWWRNRRVEIVYTAR